MSDGIMIDPNYEIKRINAELDKPIPRAAVAERAAGAGMKLSYLEGWYVIDRLNKVFGPLGWDKRVELTKLYEGEQNGKAYVSYMAKVTLSIRTKYAETGKGSFGDFIETDKEDVGFGDGRDNNLGRAHELAIKEAVTDGLKRCAKDLGMSMGLALYDKDQEFVEETPKQKAAAKTVDKLAAVVKDLKEAVGAPPAVGVTPDAMRKTLREVALVLDGQRKLTLAQFKDKYIQKESKLNDLTDPEISAIYGKVKSDFPHLNLN